VNCHLCTGHVPFADIAEHMRLIHPAIVWGGDDPGDARAEAWPDGEPVVYEDADTLADAA
jgi:hypothetical protein